MTAEPSSSRSRGQTCQTFQDQLARKRERESEHQQRWDDRVRYYKGFDDANNKFEEWTSPRYYESNNQLIERARVRRDKEQDLEKRREKLRRLLAEEEASYEIELTVRRTQQAAAKPKFQDIPAELLTDVNVGLKLAEDDKRRHEAELKLYHQWRNDNPAVKEAERARATKDLKLSWLDQQIEKRMAREKEQEECKRQLEERDEHIEAAKRKEAELAGEVKRRNVQLQEYIVKQMEELQVKQHLSDELRKREGEEFEKRRKIAELEEKHDLEEARRKAKECELFNVGQAKLKLRQRARDVEENLRREVELAEQILRSEAADRVRDEEKRKEIKEALEQFVEFSAEQRTLEERRREYLDFVFDSEAKLMYEKQRDVWSQEEVARRGLLADVIGTIKSQIQRNIDRDKDEQRKVLLEREAMLRDIDAWEKEMEEVKRWEEQRKQEIKREIDAQVEEKRAKEKELRTLERSEVDLALEGVRREEEKLNKEIIKIQGGAHAPSSRKKPWY